MINNYIKVALRNLWRNKTFSLINIFGLSAALAVCILILMWVQNELSYDRFHTHADSIFRVERTGNWKGRDFKIAVTGPLYGKALVDEYPEIKDSVRLYPREFSVKDHNSLFHSETILFADNSLFSIFSFPINKGDKTSSIIEPYTIVISEDMAEKYFNQKNPVGEFLSIEYGDRLVDLKVTGIMEKMPQNSHFHYSIVASLETLISMDNDDMFNQWASNFLYTYVQAEPGSDIDTLSTRFPDFIRKHLSKTLGAFIGKANIDDVIQLKLKPLTDIHLKSNVSMELEDNGNMTMVTIFTIIAMIILLIACVNFMNLSTARAGKRAKEVGLRKVTGAGRKQIMAQFLGESILLSLVSLILALVLSELMLPLFNHFTEKTLSWDHFTSVSNVAKLLSITVFTGFVAGIYPAFFLSGFKTTRVLKGEYSSAKGTLRKLLVVFQFSISIALIISVIIIYQQQHMISTKFLGFDREQVLVLDVESTEVGNSFNTFRNALLNNPSVENVCSSNKIPSSESYGDSVFHLEGTPRSDVSIIHYLYANYDFIDTYRMKIIAGRNFSRNFPSDLENGVLINETAMKDLKADSPESIIGKKLIAPDPNGDDTTLVILGVIKDFNFMSLHKKINPLLMFPSESEVRHISIRLNSDNFRETIASVKETWDKHFPGKQFIFSFLDDRLNTFYKSEQKTQEIIFSFTLFGILISCLGLFGLAAFSAEQKKKEIGIRKVLGASVTSITVMFSGEFTKWILISNIIAWPVAWYFMTKWLSQFAYRIDISLWICFLAGISALLIALLTVGFQAIKAANGNPVKALKYE